MIDTLFFNGSIQRMISSVSSFLLLFCFSELLATAPRISLAHFEKDLQSLAKSPAGVVVKAGSFVDRLASKRQQKEKIEQELATLQQEVNTLSQEVEQYETVLREVNRLLNEQKSLLNHQIAGLQYVSEQLEIEQKLLHPITRET